MKVSSTENDLKPDSLVGSLFQIDLKQDKKPSPKVDLDEYLKKSGASLVTPSFKTEILPNDDQFNNIFYIGDLSLLNNEKKIVSIVGTRNASEKGKENARRIARLLVKHGFFVMSGLAAGIDTAAHTETLKVKGKTIAVLGTPIHKIYPKENKELASEIEQKGLLVSVSMPNETGRWIFPRRNKLMANLSFSTIVIEASDSSGVVHQAKEVQSLGKKLIILNKLKEDGIKWVDSFVKHGAILVKSEKDILEGLFDT